jgi:hypothetical protein
VFLFTKLTFQIIMNSNNLQPQSSMEVTSAVHHDEPGNLAAGEPNMITTQHGLAERVLADIHTTAIIARCQTIDNSSPVVPMVAREALSKYLVDHRIKNPGTLNPRERQLCAWVLLEHQARNQGTQNPVSKSQIESFIEPQETRHFNDVARALNVSVRNLAP